jgi:glutaredoxin-like protein NrdH
MITVYTKPQCSACEQTTKLLEQMGLEYKAVDATKSSKARKFMAEHGYMSVPVVITDDDHWSLFRYHKLRNLGVKHK